MVQVQGHGHGMHNVPAELLDATNTEYTSREDIFLDDPRTLVPVPIEEVDQGFLFLDGEGWPSDFILE